MFCDVSINSRGKSKEAYELPFLHLIDDSIVVIGFILAVNKESKLTLFFPTRPQTSRFRRKGSEPCNGTRVDQSPRSMFFGHRPIAPTTRREGALTNSASAYHNDLEGSKEFSRFRSK